LTGVAASEVLGGVVVGEASTGAGASLSGAFSGAGYGTISLFRQLWDAFAGGVWKHGV